VGHHHHHVEGKKLFFAIVLNLLITVAQFIGGIVSGSLALLSDALHNFSDVLSLVLSYVAHRLSHRKASARKTFGYRRAEILAALFNAAVLIGVSIYLIVESVHRFANPEPVAALWVIALALLGVLVNGFSVVLLHMDAQENMNIRAAYLHLIGDMFTSVAVLVGGVAIYYLQMYWIDPLICIIIALYLIYASKEIVMRALGMLMQFAPAHIDVDALVEEAADIGQMHHIHLWQLSDHDVFLEAHITFSEDLKLSETASLLEKLSRKLREDYGITHTTFQCETSSCKKECSL